MRIKKNVFIISILCNFIIFCLFFFLLKNKDNRTQIPINNNIEISAGISSNKKKQNLNDSFSISAEPIEKDDFDGLYNDTANYLIMEMIKGKRFRSIDNIVFSFGSDGSYSGFFDSSNLNVSDYWFDLSSEDQDHFLNIYNSDYSIVVSYLIFINTKGNIELYYLQGNITLELKEI